MTPAVFEMRRRRGKLFSEMRRTRLPAILLVAALAAGCSLNSNPAVTRGTYVLEYAATVTAGATVASVDYGVEGAALTNIAGPITSWSVQVGGTYDYDNPFVPELVANVTSVPLSETVTLTISWLPYGTNFAPEVLETRTYTNLGAGPVAIYAPQLPPP